MAPRKKGKAKVNDAFQYENVLKHGIDLAWHVKPPWLKTGPDEGNPLSKAKKSLLDARAKYPLDEHCRVVIEYKHFDSLKKGAGHVGFRDYKAFVTFLDTQAGDLFSFYGKLAANKFDRPADATTRISGYEAFLTMLRVLDGRFDLQELLVKSADSYSTVITDGQFSRGGDASIHIDATMLCVAFCALCHMTTGVDGEMWFSKKEDDDAGDDDKFDKRICGYTVDDWCRAYVIFRIFEKRRGTADLASTSPPTGRPELPIVRSSPADDTVDSVEEVVETQDFSVDTQHSLQLILQSLDASLDASPDALTKNSFLTTLASSISGGLGETRDIIKREIQTSKTARQAIKQLSSLNNTTNLTRAAQDQGRTVPPINWKILDLMEKICTKLSSPVYADGMESSQEAAATTESVMKALGVLLSPGDLLSTDADDRSALLGSALQGGVVHQPGNEEAFKKGYDNVAFLSRIVNETDNVYTSYKKCLQLTYTTLNDDGKTVSVCEEHRGTGKVAIKWHQMIDAGSSVFLLLPTWPLRSCLLANETGTGKTVTSLLVLYAQSRRAIEEAKAKPNKKTEFFPHMVFLPSQTLAQFHKELLTFFGRFFRVHVYYRTKALFHGPSYADIRNDIVDRQTFLQKSEYYQSERGLKDEWTARTVFVTSISTIANREFLWPKKKKKKAETVGSKDEDETDNNMAAEIPEGSCKFKSEDIVKKARYNVVLVDEAHRLRRATGRAVLVVTNLQKESVLLLSATPFMNSLKDTEGIFTVVAKHAKIDFPVPDRDEIIRALLAEDFDKTESLPGFGQLFDQQRKVEYPGLSKVEKVFDKASHHKLWFVNPNLMAKAFRLFDETTIAQQLVSRALKGLQLRRSMHTPSILPNGTTTTPGEDLPPYKIRLCIVKHPDRSFVKLQAALCDQRYRQLSYICSQAYSSAIEELAKTIEESSMASDLLRRCRYQGTYEEAEESEDPDRTGAAGPSRVSKDKDDDAGEFHPDLDSGDDEDEDDENDDDENDDDENDGEENDSDGEGEENDFDEEVSKSKPRNQVARLKSNFLAHTYRSAVLISFDVNYAMLLNLYKSETTMLGVQHAGEMRQDRPGSGLRWLLRHTQYDSHTDFVPTNPIQRVYEVCRTSPVLAQLVVMATGLLREGKRVLVMVEQVFAQEVAVQLLTELGLEVESIRASHRPFERMMAVRRFNSKDEPVHALVTSMAVSCLGLNLHGACHHGIVLQLSWSFTSLHQTFGRLVRLGQREPVEWTLIKPDRTYANVQEDHVSNQCVTQILASMKMPGYVTSHSARLVAFEVVKTLWSQPFNRLAWTVHKPTSVSYFETETQTKLGHFLTHVAELVIVDDHLSSAVASTFNSIFDRLFKLWSKAGRPVKISAKEFLVLDSPLKGRLPREDADGDSDVDQMDEDGYVEVEYLNEGSVDVAQDGDSDVFIPGESEPGTPKDKANREAGPADPADGADGADGDSDVFIPGESEPGTPKDKANREAGPADPVDGADDAASSASSEVDIPDESEDRDETAADHTDQSVLAGVVLGEQGAAAPEPALNADDNIVLDDPVRGGAEQPASVDNQKDQDSDKESPAVNVPPLEIVHAVVPEDGNNNNNNQQEEMGKAAAHQEVAEPADGVVAAPEPVLEVGNIVLDDPVRGGTEQPASGDNHQDQDSDKESPAVNVPPPEIVHAVVPEDGNNNNNNQEEEMGKAAVRQEVAEPADGVVPDAAEPHKATQDGQKDDKPPEDATQEDEDSQSTSSGLLGRIKSMFGKRPREEESSAEDGKRAKRERLE